MKILLLNGNQNQANADFDAQIRNVEKQLLGSGHEVEYMDLNTMQIKDCIGCYACWLKTPGLCVLKDDMDKVLASYVKSDWVILATPVCIGFVSPLVKRISDRSLPLIHPYLRLDEDRMKHVNRYEKLPKQLILTDTLEDTEAIAAVYRIGKGGTTKLLALENGMEAIEHAIADN